MKMTFARFLICTLLTTGPGAMAQASGPLAPGQKVPAKQREQKRSADSGTDQAPSSVQPPVFENEKVRVFRYELAPGAQLTTAEHKTEHLVIPIGEVTVMHGPQRVRARSGEVQILKRGPGERLSNTGTTAAVVISVELLEGLDVSSALCGLEGARCESVLGGDLRGGSWGINTLLKTVTLEIANSDIDPNVTTDELKRLAAALRVAITPLQLAEQVGDEEPKMIEQVPGDVTWVPAGEPVTIKNMGKTQARYVAVTFR